jgi:hypothetical protein
MFARSLLAARRAAGGLVACLALALAACGGGGGSTAAIGSSGGGTPAPSGCDASSCGTAYIGVMDADGDFDSYTVDVVSLTLTKANGSTVETLPVKTRVDFADLVDLKEFLTAATVPNGSYVQGTVRLDYTNADIVVDMNGMPTHAVAVDANGQPLTTVDLDIRLDNRKQLVISPGRPALLELDFDLLASNTVDLTKSPVQVMVQPFIVASVDVADSREARLRGPLVSVDTAAGDYHISLRPFHLATARLGDVTVHTTATTDFEIDGTAYVGAAGLTALAAMPAGTPTAAFGTLDVEQRRFTAARVHAGTSVAGSQFDVIEGNVIARSGDQLTVRGATLIRRTGVVIFERKDTTLIVGANTKVTKDGDGTNSLTKDAISVGQRIHAFGTANEASTGEVTLDATAGRVRMHLTHLLGMVKSTLPGSVTLDLTSIDRHRTAAFNFAGTGTSPAQDAVASSYDVDTGNLNLNSLDVGRAARVFGFVTPFGTAPPDFEGRTLVDFRDVPAVLSIGWGLAGTSAPFTQLDANGIIIDNHNGNIGARHFIAIGPQLIDVKTLASPPRIVTDTTKPGTYAIGEPRRVEVYTTFADFTAKLAEKLGAGEKALGLSATGSFDAATSDFSSQRVLVEMKPAN